ncbi:MAG: ABC transporter permease, partial [Verrucomicrobiota bacterium]
MTSRRLLSEHGMILVLLLLGALFSALTHTEQSPAGEAAARQVVAAILQATPAGARVLVAASGQPEDAGFAARVAEELAAADRRVLARLTGDPPAARQALQEIQASGGTLNAIATTSVAGRWRVFTDLAADFPSLGNPRVVTPRSHRWPNFLKPANLLNIANQIAVIAIVAVGMTLVIIAGGIDLSVGSLIALSAVL